MRRLLCIILTAAYLPLAACGQAATAPPAATATAVDAPSATVATPRPATPEPTPTPTPGYVERLRAHLYEIEAMLPGSAFEDMDAEMLAGYLEPFGGDFAGIGRVCGNEAYVLAERAEPLPEGLIYTYGETSYPGEDMPAFMIYLQQTIDGESTEQLAYTLRNVRAMDMLEREGRAQAALLVSGGAALLNAMTPHGRAATANARERGLIPHWDAPEGVRLALHAFDMELYYALGYMSATVYYLPLNADEQALIARALEARGAVNARAHDDAFATSFFLEMPGEDETRFQMLGDGAFVEDWRHGKSVVYQSPELAAFFRSKVMDTLGYDPYAFSMDDFRHIAAATFIYPTSRFAGREAFDSVTIDDADKLAALGRVLSAGEHLGRGGSACSFHSCLALTLDGGRILNINIATDSCDTALIDGRIGLEDYDKQALCDLFGIDYADVPWSF